MCVGQFGMEHPSLAGMVAAIKARISRVALHYRFTADATAFMQKCLRFVLQQKFDGMGRIETALLRPFRRVLIVDSSSWDVSGKLRSVLPGSGGAASEANCKLQAVYDYKRGELDFVEVTRGTLPDNRYTDHLPAMLDKGDLLLIDLGYFKLTTFAAIIEKDAFFLTRFLVSTTLKDPLTQTTINLTKMLGALKEDAFEMDVLMGGDKQPKVACRLIVLRVSEEVANERRRKLRKTATKKGRTPSKFKLRMCGWTLLITNVPQSDLPLEMARAFYTARWQIELLFKQLKSVLRIHESHTSNEYRLRCELYGKLITAITIHRIHAIETNRLWNSKRREVSMDKLYKRLQERAFTFLGRLLCSFNEAIAHMQQSLKRIIPTCLKARQPSRLTTLEALESQRDPVLDIHKQNREQPASLT